MLMLDALPFHGSAEALPGSALAGLEPLPEDAVGATTYGVRIDLGADPLPFEAPNAARGAAASTTGAPPEAAPEPPAISLTLDQLASLCATCALYPDAARAAEVRFGIPTPAARAALDASWGERFKREPGLYVAFKRRYEEYRDWMLAQRAPGRR